MWSYSPEARPTCAVPPVKIPLFIPTSMPDKSNGFVRKPSNNRPGRQLYVHCVIAWDRSRKRGCRDSVMRAFSQLMNLAMGFQIVLTGQVPATEPGKS